MSAFELLAAEKASHPISLLAEVLASVARAFTLGSAALPATGRSLMRG